MIFRCSTALSALRLATNIDSVLLIGGANPGCSTWERSSNALKIKENRGKHSFLLIINYSSMFTKYFSPSNWEILMSQWMNPMCSSSIVIHIISGNENKSQLGEEYLSPSGVTSIAQLGGRGNSSC